jgi:RNase P subunit RPR2
METTEILARLRYLNDSSHLLAVNAPATSRYLMLQYNTLVSESEYPKSHDQRRKACGACGTLMVLGWEATIQMKRHKGRKSRHQSSQPRAMVYRCKTCNMETNFLINPAPKSTTRPGHASQKIPPHHPHVILDPGSTISHPLTNKKRSKSTKQGSLRALLQKNKENTPKSSTLDLMDFMKSM